MKRIVLLLLLSIFAQISNAQRPATGLKRYHVKGQVKQITYFIYTKIGPVGSTTIDTISRPEKRIVEFDTSGNITSEIYYSENRSVKRKVAYSYPDDRTIVINYFDPWDSPISQSIEKYDKNGFEIEYISRKGLEVSNRFVFKNDMAGHLMEQDDYIKNDNLLLRTLFHYNDKGEKVATDLFGSNGKQFAKSAITTDSLSHLTRSETSDMGGKLESTWSSVTSLFDKNGNWRGEQIDTF